METLEEYQTRVGSATPSAAIGQRIFIGAPSCVDTPIVEGEHLIVEEETRVAVLIRDLGTLTPYRELGRGRP